MKLSSSVKRAFRLSSALALSVALAPLAASAQEATPAMPGAGKTAMLEVRFLKMIIDHHFSALRITELAAGTDTFRNPAIDRPDEGVAGTPGFAATAPKSQIDEIKSLARQDNRVQREEIMTAQKYLCDWYHITYWPALTPQGRAMIDELQSVNRVGFDKRFLELFSEHHFKATTLADACLVGLDRRHGDLKRYCTGILHSQLSNIDEMRELLCQRFNECDFQPEKAL